ncbi:lipid asymmetry maintenance protein MlaB [Paenibacillus chartarius]|uniref:Lipid asymmetry maintenance protein MlaB n=1 Tax=Paenibacillus chartarius TaxID=747481 RepID=A0ABV6DLR8_9BACL
MFEYVILHEQKKTVVKFSGDLDIDVTEFMEDQLTPQLLQSKMVQIDFSRIRFVDSSGIGLLISLLTSLRDSGIPATVLNISEDVRMIFELLQLPEILGPDVLL